MSEKRKYGAEARRESLRVCCQVEKVKHHTRLEKYYQIAHQWYQQGLIYYTEAELDLAYVFLKKFTSLCSTVIPEHNAFQLKTYQKDRVWMTQYFQKALEMLEAVVLKMESEDDNEEDEFMESFEDFEEELPNERPKAKGMDSVTSSLESRLQMLKQGQTTLATPISKPVPSFDILRKNDIQEGESIPMATMKYPTIGKSSWQIDASNNTKNNKEQPIRRRLSTKRRSSSRSPKSVMPGMRSLNIPSSIIAQFTKIAEPNTKKPPNGIETCGILAGILKGQSLSITTLIIPKQTGSSDMCTMTNEDALFDYCISHDLLTLGWIHTHPSQTCFLSSVDIHTQCGFQSILPEAIAIVVAPKDKKKNVGVFQLTLPDGLKLIQNCTLTGFHQHPENVKIYSDALICTWQNDVNASVIDMR